MSTTKSDRLVRALREFGLTYPGAHIKSPWPNHEDLAVKDKTFCYLPPEGQPFSISCKLPHSAEEALLLPFTKPTGYGLGKSGWVTASFEGEVEPMLSMFEAWIDESYRAQAPKRLIAQLSGDAAERSSKKATSRRPKVARSTKKKSATRRSKGMAATEKVGTKKPARSTRAGKRSSKR